MEKRRAHTPSSRTRDVGVQSDAETTRIVGTEKLRSEDRGVTMYDTLVYGLAMVLPTVSL